MNQNRISILFDNGDGTAHLSLNPTQWVECVITEVIWLTSMRLPMDMPTAGILNDAMTKNMTPEEAAKYLIKTLEMPMALPGN